MRRWLPRLVLTSAAFACDEEKPATFVEAVYGDSCKHVECPASAACAVDGSGDGKCYCHVGYVGSDCERCEPGFHRDALDRCISDKACSELAENPCGRHGECGDENGVIECSCEIGYGGPRCQLCALGYGRNEASICVPVEPRMTPDGGAPVDMDSGMPADSGMPVDMDSGTPDSDTPDTGTIDGDTIDGDMPEAGAPDGAESGTPDTGTCQPGYTGPDCTDCAPGFHRQDQLCVADETCTPTSCPEHATCSVVSGETQCACNPGYTGDLCEPCPVAMITESFDALSGWPPPPNTCATRPELAITGLSLSSQGGEGTVQLCAASTIHPFTSPHVELEAGPEKEEAELRFSRPTAFVSFRYATRLQALSLDVLADGRQVATIQLPRRSADMLELKLDPPATTVSLRSRTIYLQNVALDELMHHTPDCE